MGLLHRLAWACATLVLAITTLSAFVRLSTAGVGCEPWPQCQVQRAAQPAVGAAASPDSDAVVGARLAHRVAASGALLLIIAMVMIALARQPPLREPGRLVLALLVLALFLALLGRLAGNAPASGVVLGNLLAGMGMVGSAWRLVRTTRPGGQGSPAQPRAWVLAALALLALELSLGGLVSAGHLAAQCDSSLTCKVHRGGALLTVLAVTAVAMSAWRRRPRVAAVLLLLVLAQAALGLAMLSMALPLPLALAHNVVAALLVATLVTLL